MQMVKNDKEHDMYQYHYVRLAIIWAASVLILINAAGCSFKVETGWHGQTGRDDRTQSQLVQEYNSKKNKY